MKLGIIKEGKTPPDHRVPLTPVQCAALLERYPELEITVQPSPIRAFTDDEYRKQGISLQEDLQDCQVLMGVKEVPETMLIPHKTYLFFSHTYKQQPYNRDLLRAILDKKIRLIDYELLREPGGSRLLGFGRYAGIVGCYNGFRAYGKMSGRYELKPAHQCTDRRELENELIKVNLPADFKIALTGAGKVSAGVQEILSALKITRVYPAEFLRGDFSGEPVFTQLDVRHYFAHPQKEKFTRREFYDNPEGFQSSFGPYSQQTDMLITGHFWSEESPLIFTKEMAKDSQCRIKLVSDISADIGGPIATTLRPSTIDDPFYGYDPQREMEVPFGNSGSIGVSAVDNLPCELPRDASEDFGNELIKKVFPHFFNEDEQEILEKASQTNHQGELTADFQYLKDYVQ